MQIEKVANYVKNKNDNLPEYKIGGFQIFVQSPLPENIDLKSCFEEINKLLPEHFINLIDVVYIGNFNFLSDKKFNAMYSDGGLYVSSQQDDSADLKDDIIHEVAHAVEEKFGMHLYGDEEIKNEYFGKMKKLKNYLLHDNINTEGVNFFNTSYNEDFDNFLYSGIGYRNMPKYTSNLFLAPYSVTSMKEYFARGFEEFFLGNKLYLKTVCPYVYKKINQLNDKTMEMLDYEY